MTEPNLENLTKQAPAIINNRSNNSIRAKGVSKELNNSFSINLDINNIQVKVFAEGEAISKATKLHGWLSR
ncbi:hypothetical protein SO802_032878 [Lithocarpus litseifolius]|uniref:Uncharacterized protein n=1 Tax=Lithocarpus litseifolius TaxID=425828 RepID=A0AAW2BD18_9ROSI